MGVSASLKPKNPTVQMRRLQPEAGASMPGIRSWPKAYLPGIFEDTNIYKVMDISQTAAEQTMIRLAREEGIFAGVSSGGSVAAALEISKQVGHALIVAIICDRGDRYLSSVFFA